MRDGVMGKTNGTLTLAGLTADSQNRRTHNDRNLALIAEALRDVGAARSIVLDEDNVVLAGNGVVQAAQTVGLTKLRVIEAAGDELIAVRRSGLTEAQKRALALYDNRTAELATWNVEQLLADQQAGLDLAPFWTDEELAALLHADGAPKPGRTDPDAVPEVRATDIQRGDLFELGAHRLLCGDSTVAADVARVMGGKHAALVFTDPPYGISIIKAGTHGTIGGDKPYGTIGGDNIVKSKRYLPIHDDDRPFDPVPLLQLAKDQIIFGANFFASKLPDGKAWIVWDKDASGTFSACELAWTSWTGRLRMYRHMWSGLRREGPRIEELVERVHPTQKPVGLFREILNDYSDADGIVIDPYLGSGTTLIAAEQLGRACRAIEIEPQYCQVTLDRWEAFTGQRAVKVGAATQGRATR
jgi:DNA modification methylase